MTHETSNGSIALDEAYRKLFDGLIGLGFRRSETAAALAHIRSSAGSREASIEELLREALLLLTQ